MAFCMQCGAKLSDNQKFCTECGASQPGREAQAPVAPAPEQNHTTYIPMTDDAPMERTSFLPMQDKPEPRQPAYNAPQQNPYAPQQQPVYTPPQQPSYDPWQGSPIPGTEKKPPKKKKGGVIALILVLLVLIGGAAAFFLAGGMDLLGGSKKENEDVLGIYNAVSCIYKKEEQDVDGEWLELKSGGKGKLMMEDESFSFKWELDDEDLTIIQSGDEYDGTLEDDVIVIDINGMEYTYILEDSDAEAEWEEQQEENDARPAAPVPEAPAATMPPATEAPVAEAPAPADPSSLDYWAGDWYGWWIINEVYEGDPNDKNKWWDCCASLEIDRNGNATMIIWDEDGSKDEELGEIYLDVAIVDGDVAEFCSTGGTFGGMEVAYEQWYCRSDDDSDYDQTFWISATYDNGEGMCFDYTFYMRPWGLLWDDVEANDPDLLPGYYDWYQEMLAAGYDEAPDTIG